MLQKHKKCWIVTSMLESWTWLLLPIGESNFSTTQQKWMIQNLWFMLRQGQYRYFQWLKRLLLWAIAESYSCQAWNIYYILKCQAINLLFMPTIFIPLKKQYSFFLYIKKLNLFKKDFVFIKLYSLLLILIYMPAH